MVKRLSSTDQNDSPLVNVPTPVSSGDAVNKSYADTKAAASSVSNVDNTSDATKLTATLLAVYPVGAIYISIGSTNPGSLFGGTWAIYGAGRMLISLDSGQADYNSAEETGGSKMHTLSIAEMPSHTHTQNAHDHTITSQVIARGGAGTGSLDTQASGNRSISGVSISSETATNQNTGGGDAHNNMPPYIATYMWKRTA